MNGLRGVRDRYSMILSRLSAFYSGRDFIAPFRFHSINYKIVLMVLFMALAAVMSSILVSGMRDLTLGIVIAAGLGIILVTFIDTNIGLILILLSMLLSPEIEVGATAGRSVVIRAEDLLLILVSLTWLAKMALKKELPFLRRSPLNAPIGLYTAILFISTFKGVLTGGVMPLKGTFYVLKLLEYFILYFIVTNHITKPREVRLFFTVLLVTALIVGLYCNATIGHVDRISAPFEGEGEPNTLGGYLLFVMSVIGGIILYDRKKRGYLLAGLLFLIPTFIFTLSRASYLGLLPVLITFAVLSRKKSVITSVLGILLAAMLLFAFGPQKLRDRVIDAFRPERQQNFKRVGILSLGPSPAARVESWKNVLVKRFPGKPFLGYGVTGAGFLDSQYFLVLVETGVIGLGIFLWLMWRVWEAGLRSFKTVDRPFYKGLTIGYLAGFVGLLVHAIGSNTFIIIRIAEPFWFFTAIIVKLPDIETGKSIMEDKVPQFSRFRY
ncbi:MAG: hypothetical protein GF392_05380 [Candidatus Omnitrophica bacterium]|nr:hypothetical protein [Candidatus Omnitrophota bacterium]